jgi:hypothetical protein
MDSILRKTVKTRIGNAWMTYSARDCQGRYRSLLRKRAPKEKNE